RATPDAGRAERRASVIAGSKISVSAAMRARDGSREWETAPDEAPPASADPSAGTSAGGKPSGRKAARRRAAAAQAARRPSAPGAGPSTALGVSSAGPDDPMTADGDGAPEANAGRIADISEPADTPVPAGTPERAGDSPAGPPPRS